MARLVPLKGKEKGLGYKNLDYKNNFTNRVKRIPGEMIKTEKGILKGIGKGIAATGKGIANILGGASQAEMRHAEITSPGKYTEKLPNGKLRWKKKKEIQTTSDGYMKK